MAYRYEQDGTLVFDGWERGISASPYSIFSPSALGPINQTGTADLSYGNITGIPGEFSVQYPLTASTVSGATLATPIQITNGFSSGTVTAYYLLDSKGRIYKSNTSGNAVTWTFQGNVGSTAVDTVGNSGICWWQGYLFVMRGNVITYSSDEGVTNTDWTGTVGAIGTNQHYAISSKVSDTMYFCNGGSGVASLSLVQGQTFDPTNAATYIFQLTAVSIPSYDSPTCLAELNGQVLIGGNLNRVYPWDANNIGGSGVTSLVGLPLFLGDRYVQRIVVSNANAYIFAGHPIIPSGRGYIYVTNGSTIDVFTKMPDFFTSVQNGNNTQIQVPYWSFGDAMWHRNQLMFGAVAYQNGTSSAISGSGGVWAIDIASQSLYRANEMGTESDFATVISPNDTGTTIAGMGYVTGNVGHMYNSTTSLSTSARVITDKVPVGTFLDKKSFEQIELKTAVALASGESIDVVVISDVDPTGVSVGSMTSTDGMSKVFKAIPFQNLQWFQIKCTLNPTNSSPTFVRLREIRVK